MLILVTDGGGIARAFSGTCCAGFLCAFATYIGDNESICDLNSKLQDVRDVPRYKDRGVVSLRTAGRESIWFALARPFVRSFNHSWLPLLECFNSLDMGRICGLIGRRLLCVYKYTL